MAAQADDRALVVAAAAGDERGWDALVRRFDPLIRRVASGFRLSADQADDVAQSTWLRVVRNIDRIDEPAAFAGWLSTTARRESMRLLQRGTREVATDGPIGHEDPDLRAQDELGRLAREHRREAFRAALDSLPPRERALLEMLARDPAPSYDEVSSALQMPVGSIGPIRGRALARLRRHPRLATTA